MILRSVALRMPYVALEPTSVSGLPMAITPSPALIELGVAKVAQVKFHFVSFILSIAIS